MLDKVKALDDNEQLEIVPVAHEVHQRYLEHLSEQYEPIYRPPIGYDPRR